MHANWEPTRAIRPEFHDPLRYAVQAAVRNVCRRHLDHAASGEALTVEILAIFRPIVDELAQYRKLPVDALTRCPLPHGPITKTILDYIKESAGTGA